MIMIMLIMIITIIMITTMTGGDVLDVGGLEAVAEEARSFVGLLSALEKSV